MKHKLIRITTVPISLEKLLGGQLNYMNSFFEVTAISADKKRLLNFGKRHDVNVFPIELTREITPLKDLSALLKLFWYLKKEKPLIVHTHTPKAGIIGMLASKLAGVPIRMHTVAGLPLMEAAGFKRNVLNVVEKLTYMCAQKVYPNSIGLQDIILRNKLCKGTKLKVLANGSSNGIDTEHFNPAQFSKEEKKIVKRELEVKDDALVFVFVGRLVGDKGINELVSAFKNIKATNQQLSIKLVLVGPFEQHLDPLAPETISEIKENKHILTTGYKEDVRPYFAIADVLVFPSYREGFPNVVMQAGAMGLPSIVTNINGCNEIIVDGENGLIIPSKDKEALELAMLKLISDEELRKRLADNSREMITSRFQQQLVWDAILEEYTLLLNQNEAQSSTSSD